MAEPRIKMSRVIEDDATPLEEAIRAGLRRPLVLWGHPGVGQTAIVEAAAHAAGLPFRPFSAVDFERWDGFRDVSESGQFREVSLERFIEKGERADPGAFALESGQVLLLKGLNLTATRLVDAVFEQVFDEEKLLNNRIPEGVRLLASAMPLDRQEALELLGPTLREVWNGMKNRSALKYDSFPLPRRVAAGAEHWAVLPSVKRFLSWGRRQLLSEEVLGFLEEMNRLSPERALSALHASLLGKADTFSQLPSPRSFAELGSLLGERRLYFSSRKVKLELQRATSREAFLGWLHDHARSWDPERWVQADGSQTLRGESVSGGQWLRALIEAIRAGSSQIALDQLPVYAAFERTTLHAWATQELGDELGAEFVESVALTEADVRRLLG